LSQHGHRREPSNAAGILRASLRHFLSFCTADHKVAVAVSSGIIPGHLGLRGSTERVT
jgi:hypothetical protein